MFAIYLCNLKLNWLVYIRFFLGLGILLQISWQILFIAEFLQNYADTIMQTSLFIIKWFVYFSMQHNIINTFLQTRISTFVWVLNNLPKPTLQKKLCYLKAFGQARNIVSGKVIFYHILTIIPGLLYLKLLVHLLH